MSTEITWNKGKPPTPGWYLANTLKAKELWSWWDGEIWSRAAGHQLDANEAADAAKKKRPPDESRRVKWADYWPEDAPTDRQGNPIPRPVQTVDFDFNAIIVAKAEDGGLRVALGINGAELVHLVSVMPNFASGDSLKITGIKGVLKMNAEGAGI